MANDRKSSRIDKFEKRRRNTKSVSLLMIAGGALVVFLIGIGIFGGSKEPQTASEVIITNPESTESEPSVRAETAAAEPLEEQSDADEETEAEEEEEEVEETNEEKTLEEAEPTDSHVVEAYTADWEPIGTVQEGPHTTNYSDGSQDRIEIKQAVVEVTGLDPENMIEWRISNGGDQKVIATVSDADKTEIYRVFLSWQDGEGWQPTQLEVLDQVVY